MSGNQEPMIIVDTNNQSRQQPLLATDRKISVHEAVIFEP